MGGYAATAPALAFGPPGWVAWAVAGTAITIGGVWAVDEAVEITRTRAEPRVVPRTVACAATGSRQECNAQRPDSVRIHAQGRDCGGTSGRTIGAPPISRTGTPITAAEGVAVSMATWGMLNRSQRRGRTTAKARLDAWILARPPAGFPGQKTFPASDPSGGKRYDVDSFGTSNNFIT